DHSKALRAIGQELVKRGIDLFELRCLRAEYYLQCGDPTPPYVGLIELSFTDDDVISLELAATSRRGGTFKFVEFEGLPEILRAAGRYVDNKEGMLLRVSNSDSSIDNNTMRLEYETRDGRTHIEEVPLTELGETARRMYKERSRGGANQRAHQAPRH
ncbi:MAG: hypothetical protein ACREPG_00005, partial [Candidatus Binatia bacterium]